MPEIVLLLAVVNIIRPFRPQLQRIALHVATEAQRVYPLYWCRSCQWFRSYERSLMCDFTWCSTCRTTKILRTTGTMRLSETDPMPRIVFRWQKRVEEYDPRS